MTVTQCEKVMDLIRERISQRTLRPGERLPSIRSLAATTGISKSTVVEAYDRLVASWRHRAAQRGRLLCQQPAGATEIGGSPRAR